MSTRGAYGFYKNGESKITYNHCDSYPDYLGKMMVDFIINTDVEKMNRMFDRIIMVNESDMPTKQQLEEIKLYLQADSNEDWYSALRQAQGTLDYHKKGLRYMTNSSDFIAYGNSCEFAYVINLDDNVLEYYVGRQVEQDDNRYNIKQIAKHAVNCKLVKSYPLDLIKKFKYEAVANMNRIMHD